MTKKLGKLIAVFAITLAVLFGLLALSAMIPNEAIRANMAKSALSSMTKDSFSYNSGNHINSISDNYADSILLGVSWYMGEGDALTSSINTAYNDGGDRGVSFGLYQACAENAPANTDYTRYVHGSTMFVRLFSMFTDADGVKQIGFIVLLLLIGATMITLGYKKHYDIIVILALSLVAVQFWNVELSLEYQPSFIICFALCPLYLIFERKGDFLVTVLSVVGGVAVAFFDFLTTETVAILLPLMLVIAVRAKEGRLGTFKEVLCLIIKCSLAWGFSYLAVFLVKWSLAAIIAGKGVFETAFNSVFERIGGDMSAYKDQPDHFLSPIVANLTVMFGGSVREQLFLVIGIGVAVLAVVFAVWYVFRANRNKTAARALLILATVVFVRYMVLFNHSYMHCFFTYRAMISPIFAICTAAYLNMNLQKGKRGSR